MGLSPSGALAARESERNKYQSEDSDEQDDTNDIELPEQSYGDLLGAVDLIGSLVVVQGTRLPRFAAEPE